MLIVTINEVPGKKIEALGVVRGSTVQSLSLIHIFIFQRILGKIRQCLVHGVMLLWRDGDADAAGRGVVLVQILKVYTCLLYTSPALMVSTFAVLVAKYWM